jgi:putative DNA methylase
MTTPNQPPETAIAAANLHSSFDIRPSSFPPDTRLIQRWLPIAEIGIESLRERRTMTALPPTYYLHVWWARRPLVASCAAILASLLPADANREKCMHILGFHGDPVASRRRIQQAERSGVRFEGEIYEYDRAFKYLLADAEREHLAKTLLQPNATVLDPTASGRSVPFETVRLGLATCASDLSPIAALIARATAE